MNTIHDLKGRPIMPGDVLKIYHFTAALRRKRHYMYKQAIEVVMLGNDNPLPFMKFSHLDLSQDYYLELCDGRVLPDYEIVQSVSCDHDDREWNQS